MDSASLAVISASYSNGHARIKCPACSPSRKNKTDKTLSLTQTDDGVRYFCHHCGDGGFVREKPITYRRTAMPAKAMPTNPISDTLAHWLTTERGISPETAALAGCKEVSWYISPLKQEVPCIAFPYTNKGKTYAAKIRAYPGKHFSSNGSPQTLFNHEAIKDWEEILIVEGELDVLSAIEAGYTSAVSVPQGAMNKPSDSEDHGKLRFLQHHEDQLKDTKKVIIGVDADPQGQTLASELARRLGRDRCWTLTFPEGCKDINDILKQHGPQAVREVISKAKPWPVSGLYDADHFKEKLDAIWKKGLGKGESTGLASLDHCYSVAPGNLTIVTGHPSNGKSELVDQIMVHLAEQRGWRFAVCSFENEPEFHMTKLISKYIQKPFFLGPFGRMSEDDKNDGLRFVRDHFTFLHASDGNLADLDSILERMRVAVMRHGIQGAVIDPYNYIAKSKDTTETEWISEMLSRVRSFAQAHGVHVWFVAHPQKMATAGDGAMPVPKGHSISGSAAWWAKADMGLTVHRPNPVMSNETEVHVWKVRFSWQGKQGVAKVNYHEGAQRFCDQGQSPTPKAITPF